MEQFIGMMFKFDGVEYFTEQNVRGDEVVVWIYETAPDGSAGDVAGRYDFFNFDKDRQHIAHAQAISKFCQMKRAG